MRALLHPSSCYLKCDKIQWHSRAPDTRSDAAACGAPALRVKRTVTPARKVVFDQSATPVPCGIAAGGC